MKKRLLSALLSALLLLALLPAVTAPARMAPTNVVVTVDKMVAQVGDTLTWTANIAPYTGRYQARLIVKVGAVTVFNGGFTSARTFSYTTDRPGVHTAEILVFDLNDNATLSGFSLPTTIKLRPGTTIISTESRNGSNAFVTWAPLAGVTGYRLLRSTTVAGPYTLRRTTTATTASDTYLTPGQRYYYKVEGYSLVDGKVTVITVPSAAKGLVPTGIPTITSIRTTGPGRINLTWKAAAGASAYQIYRSTSPTGGFAHIRNTTALTFTDVNLRPGITYYYKLRAFRRVYTTNFYGSESAVRYLRLLK